VKFRQIITLTVKLRPASKKLAHLLDGSCCFRKAGANLLSAAIPFPTGGVFHASGGAG
jgi:hypothetical protein